MLRNFILTFK